MTEHASHVKRGIDRAIEDIDAFVERFERHRMMWEHRAPKGWNIYLYRAYEVWDQKMARQPSQFLLFIIQTDGSWDVLVQASGSLKIDDTFEDVLKAPAYKS